MLELLLQVRPELNRFVAAKLADSPRIRSQEEDVLQETYIKACKEFCQLRIDNFHGLTAWIKAIALNHIRDIARKANAQKRGGDRKRIELDREAYNSRTIDLIQEISDSGIGTPSAHMARREAIDAMRIALGQLPDDQRLAMQYHYFQKLTLNETALRMERTSDSVRGLIQRAKKALREALISSSLWWSRKS